MIRKILLGMTLGVVSAIAAAGGPVDINSAGVERLADALDGVGEVRARAIVDYREANGAFASVAGLAQVEGIGDATLAKNRDRLRVGANQ